MYVTKASHNLVDQVHTLDAWALDRRKTATDAYERGLYDGYHSAFQLIVENLEKALPRVESEARLVPDVEEDAAEWLRKQMGDYSSMAGDYRDYPADAA